MRVAGETFARQTEQRHGMSADERMAMPAMRAINTDPTNKKFGITTENLTAPTMATQQQSIGMGDAAAAWANTPAYRASMDQAEQQRNMQIIDKVMRESAASDMPFYKTKKEIESSLGRKMTPDQEELVREFLKGNRPARAQPLEFADPFAMQVPQSTIPEGM